MRKPHRMRSTANWLHIIDLVSHAKVCSSSLWSESAIFKAHVASADDAEFADRLEVLGDGLAQARRGYLASREGTDRLVGEQQVGPR